MKKFYTITEDGVDLKINSEGFSKIELLGLFEYVKYTLKMQMNKDTRIMENSKDDEAPGIGIGEGN